MKAVIKRILEGKLAGQFVFVLKGKNGKVIAHGETYTQKHNVTEVLRDYFPDFKVVDEGDKKPKEKAGE